MPRALYAVCDISSSTLIFAYIYLTARDIKMEIKHLFKTYNHFAML